jgi:tRNA(Ile)-lysidine synthase
LDPFFSRILDYIHRYDMFRPGQCVAVAVSGGADSVCLLHVLIELAPRWNLQLELLHVNHALRGEESKGDEMFVRDLAARLSLNCRICEAPIPAGGNLEQSARNARLEFFKSVIASGGLDRVAVGHTRNDQAETVLFRFLRGAGSAGLAGIRPVTSEGIVRPLLAVDRVEVERCLRARNIPWREDSTNTSRQFARNRIRHDLLPQLARDWNPAVVETLAQTADWALAEEEYWETLPIYSDIVEQRGDAILIRAATLRDLPVAAARRLVRKAIEQVKGDLRGVNFEHIAGILSLASATSGSGRFQAPGVESRRSFEWLRLARRGRWKCPFEVRVAVPDVAPIPGADLAICLEIIEGLQSVTSGDSVYNGEMGCLDGDLLSGALTLRNWRPGDHYQPAGSTEEQKLKILFQKARIPEWERGGWPVLADRVSIVWSRKFGPAARVAANRESRRVLLIREMPLL